VINFVSDLQQVAGVDQGFQVSGGALKKIAPSGGRRENFWDISCEKSRFYAKKSYILGRRVPGAPPPPWIRPLVGGFLWVLRFLPPIKLTATI
jgi:hypothetical protein